MKTASPELIAVLNASTTFLMADLYTVTLANGTVYRWTSADYPITIAADTWACVPDAPVLTRGRTRVIVGLEIDTLSITMGVGDGSFTIGSVHLPLAAADGLFDGAEVLLERLFMVTPGNPELGTITLFFGDVSEVAPSSTSVTLTVKSKLELLSRQMPRNLFMPACTHMLFDAGCGLTRASFVTAGTVVAGLTPTATTFRTDLTAADDYYRLGVLTWTSGANVGASCGVRAYLNANGLTTLALTLPFVPEVGDDFEIVPGCDKALTTCDTKFANEARFRGFPWVPAPEAAR